jgi:hypothetical protein
MSKCSSIQPLWFRSEVSPERLTYRRLSPQPTVFRSDWMRTLMTQWVNSWMSSWGNGLRRGGAWWEEEGCWGCDFEGCILSLDTSWLSLCRDEQTFSPHRSAMMLCLIIHSPATTQPRDPGLQPQKPCTKKNPSSLELFSQVFCHGERK